MCWTETITRIHNDVICNQDLTISDYLPLHTFFHVDMSRRLRPGMKIELSAQITSEFGAVYWKQFRNAGIEHFPSDQTIPPQTHLLGKAAYREFWLELFRTGNPELKNLMLPSRLNSFFVVESIEDARRYITRSNLGKHVPIFEVHSQEPGSKFDMTWLDHQFPRCVFRSIRSRIGIEVRSAIRLHSINRELNFSYCFLTCFFVAFHCRFIFPH